MRLHAIHGAHAGDLDSGSLRRWVELERGHGYSECRHAASTVVHRQSCASTSTNTNANTNASANTNTCAHTVAGTGACALQSGDWFQYGQEVDRQLGKLRRKVG
jgi:hypothetical protein